MKHLSLVLAVLCLLSCTAPSPTSAPAQPNIVLILVDDLGKEWISSYGAQDIQTPHIDALADSGIRFTNVYGMPQCTPTRLSILTGQYPFRHGWVNHWDVPRWGGGAHFDETMNPSIGLQLKKAGYSTCIAGKWQIDDFRVEPDALTRNGFDEFCMWTGYETGIEASAERYQEPYLFTKEGAKTYEGRFGPDVLVDFIESFIQRHAEEPFFVYYPMVLTHTPLINTPDETAEDNLGKHKAMVRYTDKLTGRIVDILEAEGIRDNTIIIWTTDNGTTGQVSGTRLQQLVKGAKMRTWEAGTCMPFIINWPAQIKEGRVSDALIDFTDFYPTLMDLAGVEPVEQIALGNVIEPIDGQSFKEVLLDPQADSSRDWILSMGGGNRAKLTDAGVENEYSFRDRVLRNKQYKLYVNTSGEPDHFFDVINDPWEENNLIGQINADELQKNYDLLTAVIKTFPKTDNDPKYKPNPLQDWDVEITAKSQSWKK